MTVRKRLLTLSLAAAGVGSFVAVAMPSSGSAAAASTTLHATVTAGGALDHGSGVTSAVRILPGRYEVTFSRNVTGCAYVVTPAKAANQAVLAFAASGHNSVNGVYVETKNQGGGLTDAAFGLVVDCGGAKTPFAVVGYDGALVRGSGAVSVTPLRPGAYSVSFTSAVGKCAVLASVADPAGGVVANPGGVYTGLGADAKSVYVETKNPGGGLQDGVPVHLVLLCPGAAGVNGVATGSDGLAARSVGTAQTFRSAVGRYTVVAGRTLTACTTVATRGSITQDVPFTPTTVETAAGPAANTVNVQLRTLLAGGGTFTDESFYAATVC